MEVQNTVWPGSSLHDPFEAFSRTPRLGLGIGMDTDANRSHNINGLENNWQFELGP
jgi:hypothetical protein